MTSDLKSSRRSDVLPFRVMDVMADAAKLEAQGRHIIHMEVGEPGLPTPDRALDVGKVAMNGGETGYTLALGRDALRQKIAAHYGDVYNLDIAPSRIVVTTGSSAAFTLAFLASFDVGDRVAISRPGYPAYGRIMQALGLVPCDIYTSAETRFQPTADQVLMEEGLAGLLVASPSNPTGSVIVPDQMRALCQACDSKSIRMISDEIYHRMTFDAPASTALSYSDDAIIINSFSKYYCMTGWRVGWMVVPEGLVRPVERLSQNFFISPPTISQIVAEETFACTTELDARVDIYRQNRDVIYAALSNAGVHTIAPSDGAFYLYADVSPFTDESEAFCRQMLSEAGVAAVTGLDFDERDGHHFVRFSIAGSHEDMVEGARRLGAWLPLQVS
jgi:aspartate/methionine/tyrosine aminotransferase